jgi:UDP-GlcNAc:undecaprenyl-phosphate GlcNAc-1-phosphate transferase
MNSHILTASVVALLLSSTLVWAVSIVAVKAGLYDAPGPLKLHKKPIPRLGGVGLTIALITGIATSGMARRGEAYLLFALILVWLTGLIDDLRGLPPVLRLFVQIFAGLLVFRAGLCPLHGVMPLIGAFATCLTVVVFINAFNFMDGSDGLAGGTAAISAIGFAVLFGRHDMAWTIVAVSLAGACVGFLLFNFPPARIFMGDSGSTVLGLVFAALSMRFTSEPDHGVFTVPLLMLAVPIGDFCLVVLLRLMLGRSPLEGDRSHFYDRLLRKGWTPRHVALFTYGLAVFCLLAGFARRAMHF